MSSENSNQGEITIFPQDSSAVVARLQETDEARALLDREESPPLGGTPDIGTLLDRVVRGVTLDPEELLDVRTVTEALRSVSQFLCAPDRALRVPALSQRASTIETPGDLDRRIGDCIDKDGQIRDTASPTLAEARQKVLQLNADLKRRLDRYLQNPDIADHLSDRFYTMRNDRYVLPVKADARGRIRGIVHDASRSGTTLFVEPEGSVELNNRLKRAELDIQREIERILFDLSQQVAASASPLRSGLESLTWIDQALARGTLSRAMEARAPIVGQEGIFELPGLRHPLIAPSECVPNDVYLGRDFQVLVISGPNAGGKTVTLKATALAALLVRAGLHVPCEAGARVDLVETVIADIGDGQDIGASLSTFSAHMARQARIIGHAGPNSLVILDEIGTGTDPGEGAALAQAILEQLADAGARVMTTTHFGLLKEMADLDSRFANASVEFDAATLGPTYRLRIGEPGASAAASVAARMGMPNAVLERADALQNREDRQLERMLAELSTHRAALEREQSQAKALKVEGETVRDEYRSKLERLQERRDDLYQSMRSDLETAFKQAHGEVARVIRDLQAGPTSQRAARAREDLADLQEQARQDAEERGLPVHPPKNPDFRPVNWAQARTGDRVRTASGQRGVLLSLPDRKGRVGVQVGAARLVVLAEKISPEGEPSKKNEAGRRV
ncbi:MAG: endonuclease MutS2, partial [Myxococcota bacterium]|nr:endonuclease MutS2 [Myxococcota bacterium]